MKRILINSKSSEETRIATLSNGKLIDLSIENIDREQKKANIYKGYISRIEPSLNAIFINYGEEKNGFLPFKEVSEYYFKDTPNNDNISLLLVEGQELIVQINKEERGDKGAALTTFITLAGCYIVLLPNNKDGGGISRNIEGKEREKLKKYLNALDVPKNMSVIARTSCIECSFEELKHDFNNLIELWESIFQTYHKIKKPALLHKESDIIARTIRDHLKEEVKEIVVDSKECFEDIKRQLRLLRQSFDINKVKLYNGELPLFAQFGIDQQIENAYKREIRLPSGGSIIIDTTEALVAIDINSSKANKAEDVETTAFKTNLEATEEIARQLKIRDLGGLIVVDFIDMSFYPNRKQIEEKLIEALQEDRARIQMSRISKLGLVEISRQRLNSSINESVMQKCPRCEGHGFIKTTQATALTILRKIRTEALKENTNEIRVQVPVDIAAYILNEKKESIFEIEKISQIKIMIIPNFNMESPKFQMQRIWGSDYKSNRTSLELIEDIYNIEIPKVSKKKAIISEFNKNIENKTINNQKQNKIINKVIQNNKKQNTTILNNKKNFFTRLINNVFINYSKSNKKNNKFSIKQSKDQKFQKYQKNKFRKDYDQNNNDINNKNEKNKNNKLTKIEILSNNKLKKGYNQNTDDINNKNNKNKNKLNNNKIDKKIKNNNITLNKAEDIINITKLKYQKQISIINNNKIKKIISKNPNEFISSMVKDVLKNYKSLNNDNIIKISTNKKNKYNKYLKFNIVSVDQEISLLNQTDASNKITQTKEYLNIKYSNNIIKNNNKNISETIENKEKLEKIITNTNCNKINLEKELLLNINNTKNKNEYNYINYSPAIDFESQAINIR